MKKLLAILLVFVMLLTMGACGADKQSANVSNNETADTPTNAPAAPETKDDEVVNLRWLNKCESDAEAAIWQQLADNITAEHPNIVVNIENTDWTSYWTKLPIELASGNAPDLMYMHFSRASDYKDSMLPLSSYIEADEDLNVDDFYKGILDCFTFDGEIYAFPYDFGPYIMYYNQDRSNNRRALLTGTAFEHRCLRHRQEPHNHMSNKGGKTRHLQSAHRCAVCYTL